MRINLPVKTIYEVFSTNEFRKQLKKIVKQGKDLKKLEKVVIHLVNKEELDLHYKNHRLIDDKCYKNCYECHIEPDWLLVYKYNNDELFLILVNTGSHSEILNKY